MAQVQISGALLPNQRALFSALKSAGLSDAATRRGWVAFGKGVWPYHSNSKLKARAVYKASLAGKPHPLSTK
jgi:hypothetical protein